MLSITQLSITTLLAEDCKLTPFKFREYRFVPEAPSIINLANMLCMLLGTAEVRVIKLVSINRLPVSLGVPVREIISLGQVIFSSSSRDSPLANASVLGDLF